MFTPAEARDLLERHARGEHEARSCVRAIAIAARMGSPTALEAGRALLAAQPSASPMVGGACGPCAVSGGTKAVHRRGLRRLAMI